MTFDSSADDPLRAFIKLRSPPSRAPQSTASCVAH